MAASRHRGCERNRSQGPKMFATSLEDRRELPGGSQEILRLLVDTMPMQRPVRVLVVDDEENIRELLAMGLRYEGFEVEVGDGGRAALAAVPKFRPDLIVLDVMMPDLDGFEVCRRGERIELTPTEFNLLHFLLANNGRVLSKQQILDNVWQYDFNGDASVVETYVYYLRKKIDVVEPPLIHTVRGVGYTLRLPRG